MSLSYENICAYHQRRRTNYLDDRDWDSWLALYDENCLLDAGLGRRRQADRRSPGRNLLIYYGRRAAWRTRSTGSSPEQLSATIPDSTRTTHDLQCAGPRAGRQTQIKLRFSTTPPASATTIRIILRDQLYSGRDGREVAHQRKRRLS